MRRRAGDLARSLVALWSLRRGWLTLGLGLLLRRMRLLWRRPGRWRHRELPLLLTLLLRGGWWLPRRPGIWRHRVLLRHQRLLLPQASLLLAGPRFLSRLLREIRLPEELLLLLLLWLQSCRWLLKHPGLGHRVLLLHRLLRQGLLSLLW